MLSRANLFAEFQGSINSNETEDRLAVTLAPQHVSLGDRPAYLSFHVEAGTNSPVNPAALRIQNSKGQPITPTFSRHDLAGGKTSLVLAQLSQGNYTLIVNGQNSAKGVYRISVGLIGDVDGNHLVDTADAELIRGAYGAKQGSSKYLAAADADMDGRITAFDLSQWRLNSSNTAQAASASSAAFESHAADSAFSGTVYDRVAALTPTAGYKANAPMKFYESSVGWVQPLESPANIVSGILRMPGGRSETAASKLGGFEEAGAALPPVEIPGTSNDMVGLHFKWDTRHADYNNALWFYQTDEDGGVGGIAPDEPGYQAAALAAGQQIFSSAQTAGATTLTSVAGGTYVAFFVLQDGSATNNVWFSIHEANKDDGYAHFQTAGQNQYKVEDLSNNTAIAPNPDGRPDNDADFNDMVFTVKIIKVDLDTDSDNTGAIDGTEAEDEIEDVANELGKRIFVNKDDDNKNGKPDSGDDQEDYTDANLSDKDFAEIALSLDDDGVDLAGNELWLGVDNAQLRIWADEQKKDLTDLPNEPDNILLSGGLTWYIWEIDQGGADFPETLYVEGLASGKVYWQLRTAAGNTIATDSVKINVEAIVWPFTTQEYQDWNDRPTSDWTGLNVADAWWTEKALIDYILQPGDKGDLATIHPDLPDERASEDGADSPSTETYGTNVTLEFDYEFDLRGGLGHGYVQIDRLLGPSNPPETNDDKRKSPGSEQLTDRVKMSFVSNSGIKFGDNKEVAILDVDNMIALAGGLGNFQLDAQADRGPKGIDDNGMVDIMRTVFGAVHDFEDEPLNQLMSGVLYKGDYTNMADFDPAVPAAPVSQDYIDALSSNAARQNASNHMEIIFSGTALTVKINGEQVYHDAAAGLPLGQFNVQSHWGSGVVFSNMDVTSNGS